MSPTHEVVVVFVDELLVLVVVVVAVVADVVEELDWHCQNQSTHDNASIGVEADRFNVRQCMLTVDIGACRPSGTVRGTAVVRSAALTPESDPVRGPARGLALTVPFCRQFYKVASSVTAGESTYRSKQRRRTHSRTSCPRCTSCPRIGPTIQRCRIQRGLGPQRKRGK